MAPLRPFPIRSAVRATPSRSSARTAAQRWQRPAGRRGYASGEKPKGAMQTLKADLPWAVSAATVTVLGSYFLLKDAHLGPLINHPLPGENYHPDGEHDEGHEEGGEEEGGEEESSGGDEEQSSGSDSSEEQASDDDSSSATSADASESSESSSSKAGAANSRDFPDDQRTKGRTAGKNFNEINEDGSLKRTDIKGRKPEDGPANFYDTHELEHDVEGGRKLHIPDAKGGARLRIESPRGQKHGLLEDEEEGSDSAAASKTPVKGQMSGKQAGLSNTDTKHPYSFEGMSTKGEGVPETAKLQGTVDPSRKQR